MCKSEDFKPGHVCKCKQFEHSPIETAVLERRYGRFTIGRDLLERHPEQATMIFQSMIVLRATQEWDSQGDRVVYMGISPLFKKVGLGSIAPEYTFIFEVKDGNLVDMTVRSSEETMWRG